MRTIAILPVKSFGAAKQRLGDLLAGGSRRALAQAMFSDVLSALRHVPELDEVAVVTGDRSAEWAARSERVLVLPDPVEDGQSAAAEIGVRHALAAGFDRALLVPGDAPLLDPAEVSGLLQREDPVASIVPDRHGTGTNGTGSSRSGHDGTNSRITDASRNRDRSHGDLTRDFTRDGGTHTRDLTPNLTNDRSRNDTRGRG